MKRVALTAIAGALLTASLGAQSGPPINPTMVPEGSSNTFYRGAHAVLVAVADGIEHAYQFTKDLIVPGRHNGDALADLREGTTVAVQDRAGAASAAPDDVDANGNARAGVSEGTVTKVDRRHAQIVVRFAEGRNETFQLAEAHAKASSGRSEPTVEISYASKDGARVKRAFSKLAGS
ncbi:MAG TPA: hypothetical protein VH417_19215 [Vicinamibacterales bacterium]|jgi:hypothetical protein